MLSYRRTAAVLVVVLAAVGVLMGVWSQSARSSLGGEHSCGSAFFPNTDAAESSDLSAAMRGDDGGLAAACDDELSGARTLALSLLGVAALGGLALALTAQRKPQSRAAAS